MEAQEKYDVKRKRIDDAIALKEPDTVPFSPVLQTYPFIHAGYSMADIMYDTDLSKTTESLLKFSEDYDPDVVLGQDFVFAGHGPILEKYSPNVILWAGMPGSKIDKNSIHQWIEFPIVTDEDYDMFVNDRVNWMLTKGSPLTSKLCQPFANLNLRSALPNMQMFALAGAFSQPAVRSTIERIWEINDLYGQNNMLMAKANAAVETAGYPVLARGMASVPFDTYSDFYRGTVNGLADLYEHPDEVKAFCEEELQNMFGMVSMFSQIFPGKYVFIPLHKGMDGFMSDEQYREFYWGDLQKIINHIIDVGMIPYIYTEGKYTSRLECLKEVPKGKVVYHFEDVDLKKAKKILGDTACIAGGFSPQLLDRSTPEKVREEVKRIMDICAPGGGFIFETAYGIDDAKPENVEALAEAVREFGKY